MALLSPPSSVLGSHPPPGEESPVTPDSAQLLSLPGHSLPHTVGLHWGVGLERPHTDNPAQQPSAPDRGRKVTSSGPRRHCPSMEEHFSGKRCHKLHSDSTV